VPISQWRIAGITLQPQVCVSILSTVANALLGFAFAEGLVIYFWKHAIFGTTVPILSPSLSGALTLLLTPFSAR
jgi:hypothetical protein